MAEHVIHDADELRALTARAVDDARTRRARTLSSDELEQVHGGALVLQRTLINGKYLLSASGLATSPLEVGGLQAANLLQS